jgi:tetratricopeptide (TPR) repeat protein
MLTLAACAVLALSCADSASRADMPERIEPLSKRMLPMARYKELESEWRAYTAAHPGDAAGWTQLSKAAHYAGAPCDSVVAYAERAHRLAPRDPDAMATLAGWKWVTYCERQPKDPAEAIALLERALELDPMLDSARVRLWIMLLSKGRHADADAQLRVLLDGGRLPEPLVDWGYNLLVDLAPNAILLTNGDNDTCPLLALQISRGIRTDVSIVNLSMLNLAWYRRQLRDRRPSVPVPALDEARFSRSGSDEAVKGLVTALDKAGWKRPLYVACTVDQKQHAVAYPLSLEGVVFAVMPGTGARWDVDTLRIARNLREVYRLESATSPGLDWEAWSSVRQLMLNYASADLHLAATLAKSGNLPGARASMDRALSLAHYHRSPFAPEILKQWASWDTGSAELAAWQKKLGSPGP